MGELPDFVRIVSHMCDNMLRCEISECELSVLINDSFMKSHSGVSNLPYTVLKDSSKTV